MATSDPIEILLVEDNPADAELTLHALQKSNLANKIQLARDGAGGLGFSVLPRGFCQPANFSKRPT